MSTQSPPVTNAGSSTVNPNESKDFVYVGEMLPNQVLVQNLSSESQANFMLEAVNGPGFQWRLFGVIEPGQTQSLMVQWPTEARFTNQGDYDSSFLVYGIGIFPKGTEKQT